jgi:hypothetical protein
MEHVQTGKFAQSGMNMSGMGVDMVPGDSNTSPWRSPWRPATEG